MPAGGIFGGISANIRLTTPVETICNGGCSSHAASTKLRTTNIRGSPENPVMSGFFVSCSSIFEKNDYFEWYFGFTGFMRALLTSAIVNRLAIKYMVEL